MPTIDCPECGLPRAESEATKPCPVCVVGHLPFEPRQESPLPSSTDLARDASQLEAAAAVREHGHRPEILAGVIGLLVGIASVLAVQSAVPATVVDRRDESPSLAAIPSLAPSSVEVTRPDPVFAPMPTPTIPATTAPQVLEPPPNPIEVAPEPKLVDEKPALIMEFNKPDSNFQFSSVALSKGQTAILRGRLKSLAFYGLSDVTIDASDLQVEHLNIGGRFENVNFKLRSPRCYVICSPVISRGSRIRLDVPEGKVIFNYPLSGIAGGSDVEITTRSLDIRGAIADEGTRVRVTINNGGDIRLGALRAPSILEYRKAHPDDVAPRIDIADGKLEPGAVLRRVE